MAAEGYISQNVRNVYSVTDSCLIVSMSTLQHTLLDAAIPHIAFDGWTMATFERAAREAGLPAAEAHRAFPGGMMDAIEAHSHRADANMVESLRNEYSLATMKVRERIATCVMVRLRQATSEREAVRRALAHIMLPWNAARGLSMLHRTVDAMWREAGDTSTDWNYYSKRMLLGKVYIATLYAWLEDETHDLRETEAFLARRIEAVMQIEKAKGKAKQTYAKAADTLGQWMPFIRSR